jgi:hypothetical protein
MFKNKNDLAKLRWAAHGGLPPLVRPNFQDSDLPMIADSLEHGKVAFL